MVPTLMTYGTIPTLRVRLLAVVWLALAMALAATPARADSPFAPPTAHVQHAPARDYDLQHVSFDLDIDYPNRSFRGVVVNTIAPLRDGLTVLHFDCGANLTVTACEIAGRPAAFDHDADALTVTLAAPQPSGKPVAVTIHYRGAGGVDLHGLHWLTPTPAEPRRVGFWTMGEPYYNRQWLPTWDYPNDFASTDARVTVPGDWFVMSNGVLTSNTPGSGGKRRTFAWRMDQPYATYLISLVAGPMDVRNATWRGIKLMYAVPKGLGSHIADTFGETPRILCFFSSTLGVNYPGPNTRRRSRTISPAVWRTSPPRLLKCTPWLTAVSALIRASPGWRTSFRTSGSATS